MGPWFVDFYSYLLTSQSQFGWVFVILFLVELVILRMKRAFCHQALFLVQWIHSLWKGKADGFAEDVFLFDTGPVFYRSFSVHKKKHLMGAALPAELIFCSPFWELVTF